MLALPVFSVVLVSCSSGEMDRRERGERERERERERENIRGLRERDREWGRSQREKVTGRKRKAPGERVGGGGGCKKRDRGRVMIQRQRGIKRHRARKKRGGGIQRS